ncbi:MAG TPA: hypothetical protein VFE20_07345 [Thermoleophilia bacterium]|nr:hypothetical protein [Thermoleophilia bacterium]
MILEYLIAGLILLVLGGVRLLLPDPEGRWLSKALGIAAVLFGLVLLVAAFVL